MEDALAALMAEVENREVLANREYRAGGVDYVSMQRADNKADVAEVLLGQGLLLIDEKKDKRFLSMVKKECVSNVTQYMYIKFSEGRMDVDVP